jgi:prepilin-type N-terminal cleavage/methylation domain-containing protein
MARQLGFTLIEMAMVLVILGLMVGGGIIAVTPLVDQAHTTQTNTALDQVENALVLFAIRNNRLPCPADGSLTTASANYGVENVTTGATPYTCFTNPATTLANAVIPWKTLGLDESYSVDGWGNRLSYFAANALIAGVDSVVGLNCMVREASSTQSPGFGATTAAPTTAVPTNCLTNGANTLTAPYYPYGNYIAVYSINNGVLGTELTIGQPSGACPSSGTGTDAAVTTADVACAGQRAAYVLISHGKSGGCAWTKNGTQLRTQGGACNVTTQTFKGYNYNGSAGAAGSKGFVQSPPLGGTNQASATFFDDIVRWRSPSFIIQNCGSEACGNP